MSAVYDLSTVTPHDDADRRLTRAEWIIYSRGYYCALQMALKAMHHAVDRFKLWDRTKRLEAWRNRRAARAATEPEK